MIAVPVGPLMLGTLLVGPLAPVPSWLAGLVGAVLAFSVSALVGWHLESRVLGQPLPGAGRYVRGLIGRWHPVAAVIVLALIAPARLTSPWLVAWLAAAVAVGFVIRFQPALWVLFGLAKPAEDRVVAAVRRACETSGVPVQTVIVVDGHVPNAFAFPWLAKVAFTSRAVEVLSDGRLEAVALHELGHMAEPAAASRMHWAIHFIWIPIVALRPLDGSLGLTGPVVVLLALVVVLAWFRRTAPRLEAGSDERAVGYMPESARVRLCSGEALVLGLLVAGGVHTAKAAARPLITASTAGTDNAIVSAGEDVVSAVAAVTAIVVPVVAAVLVVLVVGPLVWFVVRRPIRREG